MRQHNGNGHLGKSDCAVLLGSSSGAQTGHGEVQLHTRAWEQGDPPAVCPGQAAPPPGQCMSPILHTLHPTPNCTVPRSPKV